MRSATNVSRSILAAILLLEVGIIAVASGGIAEAARANDDCPTCQASAATVAVDPASYKLWPSGSRTFLNVVWGTDSAQASFDVRNQSSAASAAFAATVQVSNHDPLWQTPLDSTSYSYPVGVLAAGAGATITVPLDPTQCDIFVSIDLGTGSPTVLRTGNPAAC